VRGLGAAVLALAGTRAELIGIELREETLRAGRMLLLGALAVLLLGAALIFAGAFVVAAVGEEHRLLALGAIVVIYAGAAAVLLLKIRASLRNGPLPFSATTRELRADVDALMGRPLKSP
jgi:uncharacterized membrane protein YqjE